MKKFIVLLPLLMCVTSNVQAQPRGVRWLMNVETTLGKTSYTVNRGGGKIPFTGIIDCQQSPIIVFKDDAGNLQEGVRITCEPGIGTKVKLFESCWMNRPDHSFAAMEVNDGLNNYTIYLSCFTF